MKAYVVDKGCYISEWLFGCSGGDSCREFCIIVPELRLVIYPRSMYEISNLVFRIENNIKSSGKWDQDPRAKAIEFPTELLLDIMEKIGAEKRMKEAYSFIKKTFISAVREDWDKKAKR